MQLNTRKFDNDRTQRKMLAQTSNTHTLVFLAGSEEAGEFLVQWYYCDSKALSCSLFQMTFLHSLQRQSTPTVLTSCHSTTTSQCTIPSLHITTYAFFPPIKTPFSSPSRLLFKAHLKPIDTLSTLLFA